MVWNGGQAIENLKSTSVLHHDPRRCGDGAVHGPGNRA